MGGWEGRAGLLLNTKNAMLVEYFCLGLGQGLLCTSIQGCTPTAPECHR